MLTPPPPPPPAAREGDVGGADAPPPRPPTLLAWGSCDLVCVPRADEHALTTPFGGGGGGRGGEQWWIEGAWAARARARQPHVSYCSVVVVPPILTRNAAISV